MQSRHYIGLEVIHYAYVKLGAEEFQVSTVAMVPANKFRLSVGGQDS
jgi:hypothetical protein